MSFGPTGIPSDLPHRYLPAQLVEGFHPPVEALASQDPQLQLGHVQPTVVLGRVVKLESLGQPLGLRRLEGLLQRGRGMRIQVVFNQHDLLGPGVHII